MKRVIAMRKRFKAFGRGSLEFLLPDNPKILAFIRKYEEESILVVANLSRYFQVAELDLSNYAGCIPEEVVGQSRFPIIRESPYVLTLGPHNYLWLLLKKEEDIPMMKDSDVSHALFLQVKYTEGAQELYLLPVSFALTRKTGQLDEFV